MHIPVWLKYVQFIGFFKCMISLFNEQKYEI